MAKSIIPMCSQCSPIFHPELQEVESLLQTLFSGVQFLGEVVWASPQHPVLLYHSQGSLGHPLSSSEWASPVAQKHPELHAELLGPRFWLAPFNHHRICVAVAPSGQGCENTQKKKHSCQKTQILLSSTKKQQVVMCDCCSQHKVTQVDSKGLILMWKWE